jgi:hypothetical protein
VPHRNLWTPGGWRRAGATSGGEGSAAVKKAGRGEPRARLG